MTNGAKLLRTFLREHSITPTAAARGVGVSHVTMLAYLTGDKRPADERRDAIERWTDGAVPRDTWRTRAEQRALDDVQPLKTGSD